MSIGCETISQQPCGCCSGVSSETPEAVTNRPALSSVAYRAGRWATFDASMLAALSDPGFPALASLRTREDSDFSVALLDAWAVVLDILTFYQERFANEALLRTAVDQRSVFELARLVGYEPSPGVAASAVLAFTLSGTPGAPGTVRIPAGSRVQSVPGPGQTAQVFETSSDLTAQLGWNSLPAQTTIPWQLLGGDTSTWVTGTGLNINPGDGLLFVTQSGPTDFHYVTAVSPNPAAGVTQLAWDEPLRSDLQAGWDASEVSIYVFAKKAALYGVQAPSPQTLATAGSNATSVPGYPRGNPTQSKWDYQPTGGSDQVNLDASYPGLAPPSGGPPQYLVLTGTEHRYTSVFQITGVSETNPAFYTLTSKTTQLTLDLLEILSGDVNLGTAVIGKFIEETPEIAAYVQSTPLTPSPLPHTNWGESFQLQTGMVVPVYGSSLTITGGQSLPTGQPIGVSGKRVRLQIMLDQPGTFTFVPAGLSTGSPASAGQVFLITSYPPQPDQIVAGNVLWAVQTLSGVSGTLSTPSTAGAIELQPAEQKDLTVGEAATVQAVWVCGDVTALVLPQALAGIYDATTVTVNGNAVEATNGQTVQEILGSGNAANDALQFKLKQPPLTYVTSPSGTGAQSTLQVWVNNLQWTEVANLLTCGPADRAFVTGADASGSTVITFGNGVQGARTPTGTTNIRALYRTGIGTSGMVSAGQLSQPLDRPAGLTSVTNPSPASGAANPATASEARASAALPTLTIGRVVSLEDYQNYALAFAGIAKAWATWTWFGDVRGVFLTVAGAGGATLSGDDPIISSLFGAIQLCSEPYVPLTIASYVPVPFTFTASVAVAQPEYDPGQVLASVWQSLSAAFAFDQSELGQNVAASAIIELIQQVPGVIALQLQSFGLSGDVGSTVPAILCAGGPAPPVGAQMLQLDPATQNSIGQWS